jgi:hypothetical protein
MYGLNTIPPSRFTKYNANELPEYSPLICAAGLVEGLILVERYMMIMWDRMPEPTLALSLHNMLVKRGFLEKEVGLYATLESLLRDSFFPDGVPTDNFAQALVDRTSQGRGDSTLRNQRLIVSRDMNTDIHQLLNAHFNRFFKAKSSLMMYYDAGFEPEKVPDVDIRIPSMLYMVRLMKTERVTNPATSEIRLKDTELVRRAKARGQSDAALLEAASITLPYMDEPDDEYAEDFMSGIAEFKDYKSRPHCNPYKLGEKKKGGELQGRPLLDLIRLDIFADVCGRAPLSSLNYVSITNMITMLFIRCEQRFREVRHPLWVQTYEHPVPQLRRQKRVALVIAAMQTKDEEALRIFATEFEEMRMGALGWEDLRESESGLKRTGVNDDEEAFLAD